MTKQKLPNLPIKPQHALLIGVMLAIISPWLLSQFSIAEWLDFSETGQIGDTIGGITAPILNITAAILIYYSFKEQYRANNIQIQTFNEERQINYILKLIDGLDQRIQLFKLVVNETKSILTNTGQEEVKERFEYNGVIGIQRFCNTVFKSKYYATILNTMKDEVGLTLTAFSELYHIVGILNFTATKIENSIIPPSDKKNLIERLDLTYTTALKINLNTFFESYKNLEIQNHEIIEMKSKEINYLNVKKLIIEEFENWAKVNNVFHTA